jgi:hypothetical protein
VLKLESEKIFIYIIMTIKGKRIYIIELPEEIDGLVNIESALGIILKRYEPPFNRVMILAELEKFISVLTNSKQQHKKSALNIYVDHLGNQFDNIKELCHYYGITQTQYRGRLYRGWTQEETLTGMRVNTKVKDHLGNTYRSKAAMCKQYGLSITTYNARIHAGYTIQDALLNSKNRNQLPLNNSNIIEASNMYAEDHLGNKYKNIAQMCRVYGIKHDLFCHRRKRGWTLEESLTRKTNKNISKSSLSVEEPTR